MSGELSAGRAVSVVRGVVSNFFAPRSSPDVKRTTSTCPPTQYISPDGLEFQTFCNQNAAFNDLGNMRSPNVTSCMDACSTNRPRCYGIAFDESSATCYLKNSTISKDQLVDQAPLVTAIANATQLASPADLSCPYPGGASKQAVDGLDFNILCNQDMPNFGDYCPSNSHASTCPSHTDTLIDCINTCSQLHPLCQAVSWNPDMGAGYANCYFKNLTGGVALQAQDLTTHTAVVSLPAFNSTCKGGYRTANNSKVFEVSCWQGQTGTSSISSYHDSGIDGCINTCANYSGQKECLGVTFDNSMEGGYENCYLLSAVGSPNGGANSSFALLNSSLSSTGPLTTTTPIADNNHDSSPSKAWIAGPVIGVVALVCLVLGFFAWRRRQQKQRHQAGVLVEVPGWTSIHEKPAGEPGAHLLPEGERPTYELETMQPR